MADRGREPAAPKPHRKRPSPFRIKTESVVALRMRPEGNAVARVTADGAVVPINFSGYTYVWAPPCPGRDEGRGLLGRHVRCFLPAAVAVPHRTLRVLEGPVVGVHHAKPNKVHMLIDRPQADALPFLPRVPDATAGAAASSGKASRRHALLEERIRGPEKVMIQVRLRKAGPAGRSVDDDRHASLQWAVLKLVPSRLLHPHDATGRRTSLEGTTPSFLNKSSRPRFSVRHVGDGNDSPDQQIANWRWLASRYHDLMFRSWAMDQPTTPPFAAAATVALEKILSTGFVGVVKEVNVSAAGDDSLASVRLERLVLPEHTTAGRPEPHHIYQDLDHDELTLQVPIEQLVVIAKSLERRDGISSNPSPPEDPYMLDRLILSKSYSLDRDTYIPLQATTGEPGVNSAHPCHRCRHIRGHLVECKSPGCPYAEQRDGIAAWCKDCCSALGVSVESGLLPCSHGVCDCAVCESFLGAKLQDDLYDATFTAMTKIGVKPRGANDLSQPFATVDVLAPIDFGLPTFILDSRDHPKPTARPNNRTISRRSVNIFVTSSDGRQTERRSNGEVPRVRDQELITDDYNHFKPTCARHSEYDAIKRIDSATHRSEVSSSRSSTDRPRNIREALKELKRGEFVDKDEKPAASGRAARANQRRFMKDVSFLGAYGLSVDSLASREPKIRFDRSSIHAWGVFADEDINPDEMIIEYRGEIISNAVAEKREKLYEQEKIGSDYMFRIDNQTVCDATKLGNVARFINASCEPNCYTKIITIDGAKRIVIYSKCAIRAGEELAYDYKFPLEYDPTKRIACHCGAKDCRGFMNWDKKYVVVESPESMKADGIDASDTSVSKTLNDNGPPTDCENSLEGDSCASVLDSPEVPELKRNDTAGLDSGFDDFFHDDRSSSMAGIKTATVSVEGPRQSIVGYDALMKSSESLERFSGKEEDHSHPTSIRVEQSSGMNNQYDFSDASSHLSRMATQNDSSQKHSHASLRKRIKLAADANRRAVAAGQNGMGK